MFLLSLEVILVYEFGEKGLKDVIPSLVGTGSDELNQNRTTSHCSYHMYRKYACKRVVNSATADKNGTRGKFNFAVKMAPINSLACYYFYCVDNFISFHLFLPLLWFLVCAVDIIFSVVLYNAATQNKRRLTLTWLGVASSTLLFQLTVSFLYLASGFPIWTEIPLMCFCIFRIYNLVIVFEFLCIQQKQQRSSSGHGHGHHRNDSSSTTVMTPTTVGNSRKIGIGIGSWKKEKVEDDYGNGNNFETKKNNTGEFNLSIPNGTNLRKISHTQLPEPLPLLVFK